MYAKIPFNFAMPIITASLKNQEHTVEDIITTTLVSDQLWVRVSSSQLKALVSDRSRKRPRPLL